MNEEVQVIDSARYCCGPVPTSKNICDCSIVTVKLNECINTAFIANEYTLNGGLFQYILE